MDDFPIYQLSSPEEDEKFFDVILEEIKKIRQSKNRDYGASWKRMRPIGITDVMSVKIERIKSFEKNGELSHEGIDDSLRDIINYALFRLLMYQSEN